MKKRQLSLSSLEKTLEKGEKRPGREK